MRSASSDAIARPRPAPCASSLEEKNGWKMWGMLWRLMPRPVSVTARRTSPSMRAAETVMPVPGGVCTSALSMRIRSTCATRSGSHSTSSASGSTRTLTSASWCAIAGVNSLATSRASAPRSVGSGRSSSAPDSSRLRSRSSVVSLCSRLTCPRTCSTNCRRVSSSSSSSASSSRNPPSEKIGVRSSCDAVAMNCSRATWSCASWRCMSSKASARSPELVVALGLDARGEVARGDLARRRLEPPNARRQRAGQQVAGEHGDRERDAAPQQHLVADERDVGVDRLEVVGEHDDLLRPRRRARPGSPPRRCARAPSARCRAPDAGRARRPRPRRSACRPGRPPAGSPPPRVSRRPSVPVATSSSVTRAPARAAASFTRRSTACWGTRPADGRLPAA